MYTITILGWYGTETLGDRAILDGIFYILSKFTNKLDIRLGSLYPFFSERTLLEDSPLYGEDISVKIFDTKSKDTLRRNIEESDLVIMGGGPIMDLEELYIVRYGFFYAKKRGIKTSLFGCGIGPLNNGVFIKLTKEILDLSDLCIFRDEYSKEIAEHMSCNKNMFTICDPAEISVKKFKLLNQCPKSENNSVIINVRRPTMEYGESTFGSIKYWSNLLNRISDDYENVVLLPNHYFFIGGDDREFMNEISYTSNKVNVFVQNNPLTLLETYETISSAYACIGMRYHSILFQTILCGNNYILDYTDHKGKIRGFLSRVDNSNFYYNRYYNIKFGVDEFANKRLLVLKEGNRFEDDTSLEMLCDKYLAVLKTHLFYGKK